MKFLESTRPKGNLSAKRKRWQDSCSGCSSYLFDATHFNKRLALERKRADRSRRPFLLMLLDISLLAGGLNGSSPVAVIAEWLAAATREVDIRGWYKSEQIIGVIFSELGGLDCGAATDRINERVVQGLRDALAPAYAAHIRASFHVFPEEYGTPASTFSSNLTLSPDLVSEQFPRKLSLLQERIVGVLGGPLGLVLLSPLFLIIAAWIKLTSRGPVSFCENRVGCFGKALILLKFRSMTIDNDSGIPKFQSLWAALKGKGAY